MSQLEKPYIQALINHMKPAGAVLEIGFWQESADEIKRHKPKSYTVLEQDPQLAKEAKDVTVVTGRWEESLEKLGSFDMIIVNGYPPVHTSKQTLPLTELHTAKTLLEEEKKIVKMVEETLPDVKSIRYTDQDLESFFSEVGVEMKNELLYFLDTLKDNGQITESQYQKCLEKQGLSTPQSTLHGFWLHPDQFLQFLIPCLEKHLNKGGTFCCFIDSSKYDNPAFFNALITNTHYDYKEVPIKVDAAGALLMVIKKK